MPAAPRTRSLHAQDTAANNTVIMPKISRSSAVSIRWLSLPHKIREGKRLHYRNWNGMIGIYTLQHVARPVLLSACYAYGKTHSGRCNDQSRAIQDVTTYRVPGDHTRTAHHFRSIRQVVIIASDGLLLLIVAASAHPRRQITDTRRGWSAVHAKAAKIHYRRCVAIFQSKNGIF